MSAVQICKIAVEQIPDPVCYATLDYRAAAINFFKSPKIGRN